MESSGETEIVNCEANTIVLVCTRYSALWDNCDAIVNVVWIESLIN